MSYNKQFTQLLGEARKTLDQFVPIVARVHGPTHAEFYEVEQLYQALVSKLAEHTELHSEFATLREVTSDYQVPTDVCESYATVYRLLAELDQAYHQQV